MKEYGIDKVFTDDDGKVMILETDVCYLTEEQVKTLSLMYNPVPVFNDGDEELGAAFLIADGNAVRARIFLDYYTPERLNLQNGDIKLYPNLTLGEVTYNDVDTGEVLRRVTIPDALVLTTNTENLDPKLNPLSVNEQII